MLASAPSLSVSVEERYMHGGAADWAQSKHIRCQLSRSNTLLVSTGVKDADKCKGTSMGNKSLKACQSR